MYGLLSADPDGEQLLPSGGDEFCLLDYVCWSAPVDDLGNWRYEGVIYRKEQEPLQKDASIPGIPDRVAAGLPHLLFAPDVVQARTADTIYTIPWIFPTLFP